MLPFRKDISKENLSSGAIEDNQLGQKSMNTTGRSYDHPYYRTPSLQISQRQNIIGTRTAASRLSPMENFSSGSRDNITLPESILNPRRSVSESLHQIQPNSSFVTQWQNQRLAFGVVTGLAGENISSTSSFQQNETLQFVRADKELGIIEKRMVESGKKFLPGPAFELQNKRTFQFSLPSESHNEKDNPNKTAVKKDYFVDGRHFIGSVEQIIRWYQVLKSFNVYHIFEIHGVLESKQLKSQNEMLMVIKHSERNGPSLQAIYCAIDRPFPRHLQPGDNIVCVGKMKGAKKLLVFNIWRDTEKPESYSRLFSLSHQALQPFFLSAPEQ